MGESTRLPGPPRWAVRATEPLVLAFSGRRWFPLWAVVHHRGRKSGNDYATPIAVIPTAATDVFLIGLPWGPKTNWARNVLAAGGATVTWKGRDHRATEPRLVHADEAAAIAMPRLKRIVGSGRFPAFLVLKR
ncbi:nitroreductase family deazaflavin-dependent oxidoreductase [Agromyces sp. NPDC058484]|uniref:nitroreductase family deazaflavin-dependent oxidoreductase n=1 Tax=Agromyces sp. NPDC058484 TaxID=3346524 RepID=UPI003659364F